MPGAYPLRCLRATGSQPVRTMADKRQFLNLAREDSSKSTGGCLFVPQRILSLSAGNLRGSLPAVEEQ